MIYLSPNNEYPRHYGDIMLAHPGWELGDELPEGWSLVAETEPPFFGENEVLEEVMPVNIDGVLTQTFSVRPMTEKELEQKNAPAKARQKLVDLGFTDLEIDALLLGIVRR